MALYFIVLYYIALFCCLFYCILLYSNVLCHITLLSLYRIALYCIVSLMQIKSQTFHSNVFAMLQVDKWMDQTTITTYLFNYERISSLVEIFIVAMYFYFKQKQCKKTMVN